MSLADGRKPLKVARRHIERLRDRADFLSGRIASYESAGEPDRAGFDEAERAAIEWALPILEVEWDNMAREVREGIIN